MYECWALISVHNGYDREWTKGWDVGTYKSTGATVFRPEFDMQRVYYVAGEDLCYAKTPPGHCVECMCKGYHKMGCQTQYEERIK